MLLGRRDRLVLLLLLLRLMLMLRWHAKDTRVFADIVDERRERRMAKKSFDQTAVALVFLQKSSVLIAKILAFLRLHRDFAFELADVFWQAR